MTVLVKMMTLYGMLKSGVGRERRREVVRIEVSVLGMVMMAELLVTGGCVSILGESEGWDNGKCVI